MTKKLLTIILSLFTCFAFSLTPSYASQEQSTRLDYFYSSILLGEKTYAINESGENITDAFLSATLKSYENGDYETIKKYISSKLLQPKAKELADLAVYEGEKIITELSDEEMLDNYRRFVEEHLKTHMYLPTNDEVDACPYIQCTSVYIRRFGSFERINELIGYNQKEFNNIALEKDMLFKYKRACKETL